MKRVLSISGGGMRGVIPARMLGEIERRTGRTTSALFDLVAGTSTGGILACLAASPKGISAAEALRFYFDSGPRIFRRTLRNFLPIYGGAFAARYGQAALAEELGARLGDYPLSRAATPLMVTTLESHGRAEMIKSWDPQWRELALVDAALMTSAAQTYFPQAQALGQLWLDGGNVRNAPMACAALEAGRLWWGEEITLIHLGTGRARNPWVLPDGGALAWASRIFDCTTNGDDSYDDYFCRRLAEFIPGFRYYRLDVALDRFPALDDARAETLHSLCEITEQMLSDQSAVLDEISTLLDGTTMAA